MLIRFERHQPVSPQDPFLRSPSAIFDGPCPSLPIPLGSGDEMAPVGCRWSESHHAGTPPVLFLPPSSAVFRVDSKWL